MIPKNKSQWRELLKQRRQAISKERREEASHLILEKLKTRGPILSFSSIGTEIDLTFLNHYLSQQGRLFLVPYQKGAILNIPLSEMDCILIPGLGFDREMYRIGYGEGYYDRFLSQIGAIETIGVGFKEQFYEELFPKDPWDIPVQELLLV